MAMLGVTVAVAAAIDLRVNTTASMPLGLHRALPPPLEHGAFVVLCLPKASARLARERGYLRRRSCANEWRSPPLLVIAWRSPTPAWS
jgi:type IV secretory pathway protease TraF